MHKILSPSCLSVRANASKRLSPPTSRWTYFERTVRDAMNEQRDPATVAEATMYHPWGMPYTKPVMVTAVEYPIMGGKAQMKVIAHNIIHPPGASRHFLATGANAPNIFWLKTRKRIPSTKQTIPPATASICWRRVSFLKEETIWRWTFSADRMICCEVVSFLVYEPRARDEILRVHAGWEASRSGSGEVRRDMGNDRPFAAELKSADIVLCPVVQDSNCGILESRVQDRRKCSDEGRRSVCRWSEAVSDGDSLRVHMFGRCIGGRDVMLFNVDA